ncbi:MAG: hypothetical protein RL885_28565 [Planctomycetota bacterium]
MKTRFASLLALSLLLTAGTASAQLCYGPDGLSGPCCTQTNVNIPTFPAVSLSGLGIRWTDCVPGSATATIDLSATANVQCGVQIAQLEVRAPGGGLVMAGAARLDYVRTWTEIDDNDQQMQVWRFLLKTELNAGPAANPGGPIVPSCLANSPYAFYYGYIDYARRCQGQQSLQVAIGLFHGCDRLSHLPGVSAIPGNFHPRDSWALVGPNSGSNPFVPTPISPISGDVAGGSFRNVDVNGGPCRTEDPVAKGKLETLIQGCLCAPSLIPTQYAAQKLNVQGTCPNPAGGVTQLDSIATPAPLPWQHMITISLGEWTGAGAGTSYPGPEKLWMNEVFDFHRDACANRTFLDVSLGVSTDAGFQIVADEFRPWLTQRQIDLASNYSRAQGIQGPFVGLTLPTRHIVTLSLK